MLIHKTLELVLPISVRVAVDLFELFTTAMTEGFEPL
jgi:hypothetical protein